MESNQGKLKTNNHIYNFYEDAQTKLGTENGRKVDFPKLGEKARPC